MTFGFICRACSYHDNAYVASRALHIVNALNTSATFHLLEMFFMQQVGITHTIALAIH